MAYGASVLHRGRGDDGERFDVSHGADLYPHCGIDETLITDASQGCQHPSAFRTLPTSPPRSRGDVDETYLDHLSDEFSDMYETEYDQVPPGSTHRWCCERSE